MKIYAIDTCALINAANQYNMNKKFFEPIWKTISGMVESGNLITSSEVGEELKDEDLILWKRRHSKAFIPIDDEIQKKVVDLLREFPTIIKMKSSANSNADPFLIAVAQKYNACIITDEGNGSESDFKIPYVCKKLGIECINFSKFLDSIVE